MKNNLFLSISNILNKKKLINKNIKIHGWIRTKRVLKSGIIFIMVNDGSCLKSIQIISSIEYIKKNNINLNTGSSIKIFGKIINSIGKKQNIEIKAKKIKILGKVKNPCNYPISSKRHTFELLRKIPHLRSRTNIFSSIARIRNNVSINIHKFMNKNGFIWISTPIITKCDTEGNSKMFFVYKDILKDKYNNNFVKKKNFLTVSGQLEAETYACSMSRVYTFGPVFRAENSNTTKHLSEFWMIEPEIAFCNLNKIINFSNIFIKNIIKKILKNNFSDLIYILEKVNNLSHINELYKMLKNKILRINYNEIINILKKNNKKFINKINWGMDLFQEHEKYLINNYFKSSIIIKNHPKNIKAFYMRLNNDKKTVASFDLLVKNIGEIIGGSQREERINILDEKLKNNNLKKKNYWWYRDIRKYGSISHSGFGIGLERLILYITGIKNVRDVIPFPITIKKNKF